MPEMVQAVKKSAVKRENSTAHIQKKESSQSISSPVENILFLQRTIGNHAVQRLIKSGALQAKLRIGRQGNKYEQEADRIAEQVIEARNQNQTPAPVSTASPAKVQLKTEFLPETSRSGVPESFIQKGEGQPLSTTTKNVLESHFGADLSGVRVHSNESSCEAADALNARAFTYGNNIYLGKSEAQTDLRLMAHETAHVLQQRAEVQKLPVEVSPAPPSIQRWDLIGSAKSLFGKATEAVGGAIGGAKEWVLGKVAELVANIPGFFLLCVILGRNPVTDKPVERNAINLIRGILGLIPGGEAIFQNLQKSGAIEEAFAWLTDQIAKLNLTWEGIKALFRQAWDSLSVVDVASPSKAFEKIKNIFASPLERIKNFAVAAGKKILDFIFEGVLKLAGPFAAKVMGIIKKAGSVISTLINDPVGFLKNLIHAVRKGFDQFSGNILTHLKEGLMKWLFGALSDAGLKLPDKFDLMGILSIVLQVLGLTYSKLRAKLVKVLGEKPVAYIEKAFEFLYLIVTKGLGAAWEKFLEFIGDLKEMVLSAIRDWVVTTIVKKAIMKLVSMFNPVGAIVQAIMMIYDTVTFFIERIKQIMELAEAVFDSIANIAAGKLDAAANYVEKTMARTIPVIIGFLASLIGLGGISAKIKKIIEGIQAKVEMALDKIVNFIVTKAKALLAKGKEAVGKIFEWWKLKRKVKEGEEEHTLHFEGKEDTAEPFISSSPRKLIMFISEIKTKQEYKSAKKQAAIKTIEAEINEIYNLKAKAKAKPEQKEAFDKQISAAFDEIGKQLGIVLAGTDYGTRNNPILIAWPGPASKDYPVLYFGGRINKKRSQYLLKKMLDKKDETGDVVKRYEPHRRKALPGGGTIGLTEEYRVDVGTDDIGPLSQDTTPGGDKLMRVIEPFGFDSKDSEGNELQLDHVREIQFGGRANNDKVENLWPLERSKNARKGSKLAGMSVELDDGQWVKIADLKKISSDEVKKKKKFWFKVKSVES